MPFKTRGRKLANLVPITGLRLALNFDGIGIRGTFANTVELTDANPVRGKFKTGAILPSNSYIFGPNEAAAYSSRIRINSDGSIAVRPTVNNTDVITCPAGTVVPNMIYSFELSKAGTLYTLKLNGVVVGSGSLSGGGALFKWVGATATATTDVPIGFFSGLIYDFEAGGVKWPMDDRNQSIQLPEPSGLGAELITQSVLENPAIVGTQWSYLGDGRWQYIGDGSPNVLAFIGAGSQPSAGYLTFEVESITGGVMRCSLSGTVNNASDPLFSTVGVKRYFFTARDVTNAFQFARNTSTAISCVIKNISFKPLGTCNPMTISNATSANWVEVSV